MKINFSYKANIEYLFLSLALISTFFLLFLFDVLASDIAFKLLDVFYKLLNDIWTGLLIGILFLPVYLMLTAINKRTAIIIIKVLFSIIILIQFALIMYNHTTQINLGADILGYSFSDIFITVSSSEAISIISFSPFILLPLVFLGIYHQLKKLRFKTITTIISLSATLIVLSLLHFFVADFYVPENENKFYFFMNEILKNKVEKKQMNAKNLTYSKEYPAMKSVENPDVLSPFFNIKKERPNIVFIIVEGLGDEFIGGNNYSGFTPYLDSLLPQSLYWENFVSNTGRTFGILPSLLGSLPYGEKGFLEIKPLPYHNSLLNILKMNGYHTSYYSGDESSFDKRINFLEYNGIDNVIDVNKFGEGYTKTKPNAGGFSWGYPDAEIFKKTLDDFREENQPRLDIIMTLSNHEPFDFPSKNEYLTKVDNILKSKPSLNKQMQKYKDIFACLLYTDNSIKDFIESYSKRSEYNNTIFIITGDHRLIPLPQKDKLCRFHVPLYIYSPLLKKPARFKSISSHWDVTPSIVSFLAKNYNVNNTLPSSWMGNGLDTARQFRNIHQIPMMRSKGSISDYIYKDYLYSDGELYKIKENFETDKISDDELLETISDSLKEFKRLNAYLTKKNKIYPKGLNAAAKAVEFSATDLSIIKAATKGLDTDQMYYKARELAFNKEHKKALLICDYILNEKPNFVDTRILKGRVFGWDGNYIDSEKELLNAISRSPFYYDAYSAIMDVYKWSDQDKKAIPIGKKALKNKITEPEIGFKLAVSYKNAGNLNDAKKTIDSLIKIYPKNKEYLTFKNSVKK